MTTEIVSAVAFEVRSGLFCDIEYVALPHQLLGLFVGIGEGFCHGCATTIQKLIVHFAAKILPRGIRSLCYVFRPDRILRRIPIPWTLEYFGPR